jgi:hypothetical protein
MAAIIEIALRVELSLISSTNWIPIPKTAHPASSFISRNDRTPTDFWGFEELGSGSAVPIDNS